MKKERSFLTSSKTKAGRYIFGFLATALFVCSAASASAQLSREQLARITSPSGYPSEEQRKSLLDEYYFQRAVQVYLGALPAVNMLALRDGSEAKWGTGYNILPTWKKRMGSEVVIPTPNCDVIYAQSYLDLKKDGPLVVIAPPGLIGMFTDFWQRSLTDVGVGGPDKGMGGAYLLLPPDYNGPTPEGYYTFRSPTYNVFLFWRAPLKKGTDGPDATLANEHIEKTIIYPLRSGIPSEWKKMQFPDASGTAVNMMYPRDASFFERLAAFINYEPGESVEPYLRGMMASIGIIKGQPFKPDAHLKAILQQAAEIAPKMAQAINLSKDAIPQKFYYTGNVKRQWINGYSAGVNDKFYSDGYLNLDVQSSFFLMAYSSAPYMNMNNPGMGARYPSTFWDAEGNYLTGDKTYQLHLPPNVPAGLFWSVTLYSPVDGRMIVNGTPFPSVNSMENIAQNKDGSYDLYFGPQLPAGKPSSNWIKTNAGEGYAVALRLYGATMPFYDQTWIPDDVKKIK